MRELFSLRTVRSKIVMMTKAAGVILILSYFASKKLPFSEDVSSLIWAVFIVVLTLILDALLGRCITRPVAKLCEQAQKTAQLDFSGACAVTTADEFGSLADSLNQMAKNLQGTLARLEAANAQLEKRVQQEHQLLEERKEIVDHLSHEMKTPLGVIRAYAEGLQDETDAQTKQSYAGVIIAETERMSTLITTLLDLSALENGAARLVPEQFDFVELFETEAGRLLIDVPEPYFSLEYELPPQRVFVLADRARMGQVLDNLIVNAKKNVVQDGVIHLSCALQNDRLHVSIYNQCAP
ncbi:MAG: cell wall metabolism sensor histidine kinase WalK, partial [Lachnospiraceae bacterium]|nr:cell wall metabolism sensor histidine kinase WalK [Lachnospiraceae bacterium]